MIVFFLFIYLFLILFLIFMFAFQEADSLFQFLLIKITLDGL